MGGRVPILVVGDAPGLSTGLSRIARDITAHLHAERDLLGIEVAQLGIYHDDSMWPWPVVGVRDQPEWGKDDLPKVWWRLFGNRRGVVFTVWDPARCFGLSATAADSPVQLWGYFALDADGVGGRIGGPAAVALRRYGRVLGYGGWGAEVLKATLDKPIQWLPHGIDLGAFQPQVDGDGKALPRQLIGCVAANQPRKDLGLLFQTFRLLADWNPNLGFWLHTDVDVKHWSIPQLADDFGLNNGRLIVTGVEKDLSDNALAQMYSQCLATIAPGLGEGFGYPIVESLACGAPVIHGNYGGGAELVPHPRWRIAPETFRLESVYCLRRPVFEAQYFAHACKQVIGDAGAAQSAYCRGAVRHLGWDVLWPQWRAWFQAGLRGLEG